MAKVMTELQKLKGKKKAGKLTPDEEVRLKQLIDGEPISATELAEAKKREADRLAQDKADYAAKHPARGPEPIPDPALDAPQQPAEHPRVAAIKAALLPFTQIECHPTRANEFILFNRGVSITAGDIRNAKAAMKL